MTIRVPVPADFSFETTVTSHGWFQLPPFRWDPRNVVLERTEQTARGPIDLVIRPERRAIAITSDGDLGPLRDELLPRIRRMFQLDVEIHEFLRLCRGSPAHRKAARLRFGRLLCGSTRFEDAIKIVATTNTRWAQTRAMLERLVDGYGERSASGRRAFPTPRRLARVKDATVARRCRMGYRSAWVPALGRMFAADRWAGLDVGTHSTEELIRLYRSLPGIGPYGAAHLAAMDGRHDFIAIDTEFRAWVRATHFGNRDVSDRVLARHYDPWGRWRYLAYWSELRLGLAPVNATGESPRHG